MPHDFGGGSATVASAHFDFFGPYARSDNANGWITSSLNERQQQKPRTIH